MRTLFVGDVHGCSKTLRRLLKDARADRVILLGDLFAKGPDPVGTWEVIQEFRAESVVGNHDERILKVWGEDGESTHHRCTQVLSEDCHRWLAGLPLYISGAFGGQTWVAVHAGLHPELGVPGTSRKQAMILRRWPDDEDKSNPFWWELYAREERVFYGHDAVRGLQLHKNTTGLDSGCMYGNFLSGFVLETGELLSVDVVDKVRKLVF